MRQLSRLPLLLALLTALGPACGGSAAPPPQAPVIDLSGPAPGGGSPRAEPDARIDEGAPRAESTPEKTNPKLPPKPEADADSSVGYLTVVCSPLCDEVINDGKRLGPSPVVHLPVKPGEHSIELRSASEPPKTVRVVVIGGQVSALRASMKSGYATTGTNAQWVSVSSTPSGPTPLPFSTPSADEIALRQTLEPKAWAGKATIDELRFLRAICSHMADRACRDRASSMIKDRLAQP